MKKELRNYVVSALLLVPGAASLVILPSTALAQWNRPEVRSLSATADGRLEPGTLLTFTLEGTPRAQATLRIRGLSDTISLRETERGVYVGRYTLSRSDRIDPDATVRATVDDGERAAAADYALAEILPRGRAPLLQPRAAEPRIERFGIAPIERIEPGTDLRFALEGTPGARVTIDVPGVGNDIALREVRSGVYEGGYTIRRVDNFNPNRPIVATMRIGERVSSANVAFPVARLAPDTQPPAIGNLSPREGEQIRTGAPLQIGASFDDGRGSGVDPSSVQVILSGRNVTRDAQINREGFNLRAALPPGRHLVEVTARDLAGNTVRRAWNFEVTGGIAQNPLPVVVAPAPMVVVPAVTVSLGAQVINHIPNEEIGPDPILIKARTYPGATVLVNVRAIPPAPPAAGQARTVYAQTLQADGEGIISFTMVPGTPYPGERYEIVMVSRRGSATQESRFMLQQRPG